MTRARFVICSAATLAIAAATAASCGSSHGVHEVTPSQKSAPEVAWRDKTHEQRVAHMKSVVLPVMSSVFSEFDREQLAAFDCKTCHGSGADQGSYRMPNPDLPHLPGSADGFEKLMAEKEKVTTFMATVVVPGMATMLGEKPYGPDARDGFGCFRCHVTSR